MVNINAEAKTYSRTLERFVLSNELPRQFFDCQDHVAFKAYNSVGYVGLIDQFKPISYEISEMWQAERRLAVARLKVEHALDTTMSFSLASSRIYLIELMEAKPDDRSDRLPGLDHEEVYFRNLAPVREVLQNSDIPYVDQHNESHAWVSVQISEDGDELKFTDKSLGRIVGEEKADGRAKIIWSVK